MEAIIEDLGVNQNIGFDISDVMPTALASGLFVSLCTIQQWDGTLGASGAPDKSAANWDDVTGLVDIQCMAPPEGLFQTIRATEAKTIAEILAMQPLHVLLDAFYPNIESDMRAVVDGTAYDIMGVEWDSQRIMTRLCVRLAVI